MSRRTLPPKPNIDQLKRQAKQLLRGARAADPAALERFRVLPSFATIPGEEIAAASPALHDAQSVVAREYGFVSWKALAERVEELTLQRDEAAHEFVLAATDGRTDRARRLLDRYPDLPRASLHAALVLGAAAEVAARLARDPASALREAGPRTWQPLLYACHSGEGLGDPDGLAAVTRLLLEHGADPNTRFPWLHHGVRRPALWGALLVARAPAMAQVLLQAGADPNDGVTLPILASAGDTANLDLLLSHGADPDQRWATDGSATLYAILQWSRTPESAYWLLDHGADADPVFAANGETPLHVAARLWDVPMAQRLVARGARIDRPRADGRTPYAVAELNGNSAVADWLLQHGSSADLPPVDRMVAACSRGDRKTAEAMLAADPGLRTRLGDEHYLALHRAAEQGDLAALEALLACGLDVNRGDPEIGKTALHSAAMAGQAEAVRVLLAHGASTTTRDREFHAQPLVWAVEGSRSQPGADHAVVGRLLLDAGSPVEWSPGEEPADALVETLQAWHRAWSAARLEGG